MENIYSVSSTVLANIGAAVMKRSKELLQVQ